MTPEQVKNQIRGRYMQLKDRVLMGTLNESSIYSLIKSEAMLGAKHNGIPEYWVEYMPEELK